MPQTHLVEPDKPVDLSAIPTCAEMFSDDRSAAEREFRQLRDELVELQRRLYAQGTQRLLVVFQAMDAGGKDSTIRKVFRGVNPQGVRVYSFKKPSKEELAHDYLWRIHKAMPPSGMIHVFNRSHYEDIIVPAVHHIVDKSVWGERFEQINEFESYLAATGTKILKFYLHISPEEQKKRFLDRIERPEKNWKFSSEDLEKRKHWHDYMAAFEEILSRCSKADAPWYVVPADQKWYRNLAIARTLVDTLETMNPQFPLAEDDLQSIVIE